MFCPKCGTENHDNNYQCTQCAEILHPAPTAPAVVVSDVGIRTLIPYKNGAALGAYYCGVFSVIPLLGIGLGVAAVFLGLKGLRNAREHPEVKGKVHAWVGIIVGGTFGLAYIILATALISAGMKG